MGRFKNVATGVLWIVMLGVITIRFFPSIVAMPAGTLDSSWIFAVNQAVEWGLSFGRDIIFPFGPYASIFTRQYHPATDFMMVGGSLYLALSCWIACIIVMKEESKRWAFAFCIFFAFGFYAQEALLYLPPFLAGLASFKILLQEERERAFRRYSALLTALVFVPLGLVALIKGSMLVLSCAVVVLCAVFFVLRRRAFLALICVVSFAASISGFWLLSGPSSLAGLPDYFINMMPLVSGYSEAMGVEGKPDEIAPYLIACLLIAAAIFIQKKTDFLSKLFLAAIFFLFLFLSFKSGFVRHDAHAIAAGGAVMSAALMLPFVVRSRLTLLAVGVSAVSWFLISTHYYPGFKGLINEHVKSNYAYFLDSIKERMAGGATLKAGFDSALADMRQQVAFPVWSGTTDIYSYHQGFLLASGNNWSPRPVIQSYSAYTPALAEKNKAHLLGSAAPDQIVFNVEPIDGRFPSLEDGASWPVLLAQYQPVGFEERFLVLRKRESANAFLPLSELKTETHRFGEQVSVPRVNEPLFVQLDLRPTLRGRILNALFKPEQLTLTVELETGLQKSYRLVAGMAHSGFLLSPLIEDTEAFRNLYRDTQYLEGKQVKSFSIEPSRRKGRKYWNRKYLVRFSHVSPALQADGANRDESDHAGETL